MVAAELRKTKNDTPVFFKTVFLGWVRKWVLLTVFLKSCVVLKTPFYSFFSRCSSCSKKTVCWKKAENLWKIVGSFWILQKLFCLLFFCCLFEVIMFWGFVLVFGKVAKVLKMLVFPQLWGLLGEASSWVFGFGRFRCFCVSCLVFLYCVGFIFVCLLVFGLLLDCFWCCSCFCFGRFVLSLFWGFCFFCLFVVLECFVSSCCVFLVCVSFIICLLEWSRCCSSFFFLGGGVVVLIVLVLCFFVFVSFCFFLNHCFFPAILVFWDY